MSNQNTIGGFFNLPQIANPGTTAEFVYKVPAAGLYPGLPSPTQAAGAGLVLQVDAGDVVGTALVSPSALDGRSFKLRINGKYNSHGAQNMTVKIYQVPAAILAAGTQATTGNDAVIVTSAALAAGATANNLDIEAVLTWDAASKVLNAVVSGLSRIGSTAATVAAQTPVTAVAQADLNFMMTFTLSAGTAADLIGPLDFTVERV